MAVDKLHTRKGVTLKVGAATFGRPKNNIQINDSRGTTTITDFSSDAAAIQDQIAEGRTVTLSWTANLVTSDAGYQAAKNAYDDNEPVDVTVTSPSVDGTDTFTATYNGFFSQFNVTLNESGVAEVAINFAATEIVTTP